jgi:predicted  nucleic acid-binding Zn-ribbon protein
MQLPTESPIPGIYVPLPRSASASPAVSVLPSIVVQPLDYDSRSSEEELSVSPQVHEEQFESEPEKASDADDGALSEREPTFSSASSDPSYPVNRTVQPTRSPDAPSTAFSSPAPSATFTPTPAIVQRPRPRPRFNIPPPPEDLDAQEDNEPDSEPVTPHTRRRSFLLSVINSTARPRMKIPTPHPHRRLSALPVNSENETDVQETPPLRKAFVGITPRPGRGRMSHPLAQTYLPDGDSSETGSGNNVSPYDAAGDRASFISTASSHDLATHVRANTSYDPAIGLGERGKMGRFDAQKLNAYLHGLNHRLQEENLSLVERLQKYEEVKEGPRLSIESAGRGRRISAGGTLGDVEEESGAEGWAEEKLELEAFVQEMEEELDQTKAEKAQVSKDLEKERNERARDKERWRERMEVVEKGVSEIVSELERKVEEAERKHSEAVDEISKVNREADKVREHLQTECDLAMERAAKAESAMVNGKELGGALKEANSKVGMLSSDLHAATAQIKELEEEVMAFDRKVDELEKELKEEKLSNKFAEEDFHSQLSEMGTEVMRATARVTELEKDVAERDMALQRLEDELEVKSEEVVELQQCMARGDTETAEEVRALKAYTAELEESAAERVKILEGQLAAAQDCVDQYEADEEQVNYRMESLEKETEKATELARQMEEALEAAEEKMKTDEEMLADLRIKLASLERERERQQDSSIGDQQSNHEVEEALEAELDEANGEIARLTTLLNQSPARRAIEKAKDARIEMLEGENEELMGRIRSLKSTNAEMATPSRVVNMSGISPIHRHVLSMALKTPKTPGAPLRDVSSDDLTGFEFS